MKLIQTESIESTDPDFKIRTKDVWWSTHYEGDTTDLTNHQKDLLKLRDILIGFGGDECCFPFPNIYVNKIRERGFLKIVKDDITELKDEYDIKVVMSKGEANQCHLNSANLWCASQVEPVKFGEIKIMTGYALHEDSMWRQHTWCYIENCNGLGSDLIIETTEEFIAYYGFVLTPEESIYFANECV